MVKYVFFTFLMKNPLKLLELVLHEVGDTGDLPPLGSALVRWQGEGEDDGRVGRPAVRCWGQYHLAFHLSRAFSVSMQKYWIMTYKRDKWPAL